MICVKFIWVKNLQIPGIQPIYADFQNLEFYIFLEKVWHQPETVPFK